MMHWKASMFVPAFIAGTLAFAGCSQPCRLPDYAEITQRAGLPSDLPCAAELGSHPLLPPMARPTTIFDLDREPYYITLKECIALALEKGNAGTQSLSRYFTGNSNLNALFNTIDELAQFQLGFGAVGSDSIRVLAYQPAVVGTDIEASLARYDVVWRSILGFNTKDNNPLGPNAFGNGQFTAFGTSLEKGLATGGLVNVTFGSPTNAGSNPGSNFYNNFAARNFITGTVNPSYTPNLSLNFSQPLLRGFGTGINSLLNQHPLSPAQQIPGSPAGIAPAIVIARINFDQSRAEFERIVNYMVLNVEASYYQLYSLYVNLYSTEQALKQSHTAWKISKARYEAGQIPIGQFELARGQYENFRAQRVSAVGKVLEQERQLRLLCGLAPEDGKRLVPVDTPTVAPYVPDWTSSWHEAMTLRPELTIARADIKRREAEMIRERNNLLPDVRLEASYNVRAFGNRLDGDGVFAGGQTNNAFRDLAGGHFTDYNVGLTAAIPLGFRAQHAGMHAATLRLMQAYLFLRDTENKAANNLTVAYRLLFENYETIEIRRAERTANANQVEARFKEFQAGKITVDFLLEAQRQWAASLAQEYQAITNYNLSLAIFQFSKGTLLHHNGIQIAEGPLPQCVQVRAVEHERERAHAIACLERATPVQSCGDFCPPAVPVANAPSLPALQMDQHDRLPAEIKQGIPAPGQTTMPIPYSGGAVKTSATSSSAPMVTPVNVMISGNTSSATSPAVAPVDVMVSPTTNNATSPIPPSSPWPSPPPATPSLRTGG